MGQDNINININEFTDCEYYNMSWGGICDQCTLYGNTSTSITKCSDVTNCFIKDLYKQVQDKKQQNEELRQLHNSCCEEFKQELNLRIEAYNKLSRDFFNSKYCDTEHCKLLKEKEQECERLSHLLKEAEEAPICFQCKEEHCIRQERDKYLQSLNEIEEYINSFPDLIKESDKIILDIINRTKVNNNDNQ